MKYKNVILLAVMKDCVNLGIVFAHIRIMEKIVQNVFYFYYEVYLYILLELLVRGDYSIEAVQEICGIAFFVGIVLACFLRAFYDKFTEGVIKDTVEGDLDVIFLFVCL